jgi:hypothetical protein
MSDFVMPVFEAGQFIGLVAVVCGAVCIFTAIVAGFWRKARRTEAAAALTREMVARGMSAEEIIAVLTANKKAARRVCG